MADSVQLEAQERPAQGTRHARKLRKEGLVPAVVYGHKIATESVAISGDLLGKAIRHGARVVDLKQKAGLQKALIREVQWDAMGHAILHVDFARVAADERITLEVRVELRGTAPGIAAGGVLVQPIHNLSVECLVIAVPESIRVNIGELQLNQAIHVKDLVLAEGLIVKNDPEAIIVQVAPQVAEAAAAAVPGVAAEQAEPEVIGRAKTEEEAAEE
jgi:large subunit ribosomal protein L25